MGAHRHVKVESQCSPRRTDQQRARLRLPGPHQGRQPRGPRADGVPRGLPAGRTGDVRRSGRVPFLSHGPSRARPGAVAHRRGCGDGDAQMRDEGTFGARRARDHQPARDSITTTCNWQSLLLRDAQARDERDAGHVVALHADGRPKTKPPQVPIGESIEFDGDAHSSGRRPHAPQRRLPALLAT